MKQFTVYVDTNTTVAGNGSRKQPFKSIRQALEMIKRQNISFLINIAPGVYVENINILFPTILRGTLKDNIHTTIIYGCILNKTSSLLSISNIRISDAPAPGAIIVMHKNAKTIINNVEIFSPHRFGIYQNRGTISINDTYVRNTLSGNITQLDIETKLDDVLNYGSAIYLKSASGTINNVQLYENFQGIIANKSNLSIYKLMADRHKTVPELHNYICSLTEVPRGLATIEAYNESNIQMDIVSVYNGELTGIFIHDNSRVKATNTRVMYTKRVPCTNNKGGGNNILVTSGSHLELQYFEISYAELCGIAIFDSFCKLTTGQVNNNLIGAHVDNQINDLNDLTHDVIWKDNVRNLDSDSLPVPDPSIPD
jgi:hypothetical protein